jgi:hypothetical protein
MHTTRTCTILLLQAGVGRPHQHARIQSKFVSICKFVSMLAILPCPVGLRNQLRTITPARPHHYTGPPAPHPPLLAHSPARPPATQPGPWAAVGCSTACSCPHHRAPRSPPWPGAPAAAPTAARCPSAEVGMPIGASHNSECLRMDRGIFLRTAKNFYFICKIIWSTRVCRVDCLCSPS